LGEGDAEERWRKRRRRMEAFRGRTTEKVR
jgi:hypothetical protein